MVRVKIYNVVLSHQFEVPTFRGTGFTMIKFKECPRCQGDLYIAEDSFGKFLSCMQCGYLHDLEQPARELEPVAATHQEAEREAA